MRLNQQFWGVIRKRQLAAEHLKNDDTQTVVVTRARRREILAEYDSSDALGAEICEGSTVVIRCLGLTIQAIGTVQINQHGLLVWRNQYVFWAQIAVSKTMGMKGLQCRGNLQHEISQHLNGNSLLNAGSQGSLSVVAQEQIGAVWFATLAE